jgi:cyclic pyranopterin phosphate synthase
MPEEGVGLVGHADVLSYEEIVRIVRLLARMGVKKVRLTGGEPLVRKGLASLVAQIKGVAGIERVVLTTNGMLLSEQLNTLVSAGLDGVNISLDAIDEDVFRQITRRGGVERALRAIDDALARPELTVKLNCVPTALNHTQLIPMAERFLRDERLALRFIELMPIGLGKGMVGIPEPELKALFAERFGTLTPLPHESLAGPCRYFRAEGYPGRLGFISAVSDCFCAGCNRVRLTSGGFLKTCLQFDQGVELKPLLAGGDEGLLEAVQAAIGQKPERHLFTGGTGAQLEGRIMSQIGG